LRKEEYRFDEDLAAKHSLISFELQSRIITQEVALVC
jgi:hypothetical protein